MINEIIQAVENLNKKFGDLSLGQLNELIKKFKSNKTNNANIDGIVENLTKLADRLNTLKIDDSGIIDSITRIVDASKQLKDAVKDAETVKEAIDKSSNNKSKKQKERTAKDIFKDQLKYQKQYIDLMNKSFSENGLTPKDAGKLVEVKQHLRDIADEFANIDFNTQEAKNAQDEYNRKINDYIEKVEAENKAAEKIQIAGDFESAQSNLKNLSKKIKDIIDKTGKFRKDFRDKVDDAFVDPDSLDTLDKINAKIKEYNELIEESGHKENLEGTFLKLQKYQSSIADILNKNTAMPRELQNEFKALQGVIDGMIQQGKFADSEVIKVQQDFERLNTTLKESGRTGKSFFDTIGNRLKDMNAKFIAQFISMYDIIRYTREIFNVIEELDTSLVDLRKTTAMSTNELEKYYYESNKIAKQMGVTTNEIIQQSAAWSRLGYNTAEQTKQMAQLSSKFASISPGMDSNMAQEGLVSIMKAWDIETEEVERRILDNINTLGNKFAETNADIVTGMEKSAATFAALGQSSEDAFALFTGAQEVMQNAEVVGTALKTLSLRIRGYDEETEQLSEDLVDVNGKVANLTKTAQHAQGISLFTDASQQHYRSMVDYLGEIADRWDEIDEKSRTQLLDKLFGKRGASVGSAILGNFDQVRKALTEMEEAAGSADAEMDIIRDKQNCPYVQKCA